MSDMTYEEHCPCGNTIKVSGYKTMVEPQAFEWRNIHNKHMNAIAKAIAEAKAKLPSYPYYSWTWPNYSTTTTIPMQGSEPMKAS